MNLVQRFRARGFFLEAGLIVVTAVAAFWFAAHVYFMLRTSPFTDFDILFDSAVSLATGHSPYEILALRQAPFGPYYKFPPLVDIVLARISLLNFNLAVIQVARIYAAIGLALYVASFVLLAWTESIRPRSIPFYLLAIGFLSFQPSLDTLYGAQHEFVILMLFTLAYWGLRRGRGGEWVAGAGIAVITLIKIYPILLLPYFLLRRLWNAAISLIASLGALTLISVVLAGWELQKEFWFGVFPALSGGTAWLENQSFFGFFARLFVNGAAVDPDVVTRLPIAMTLSSIATVVTLAVSLVVLWRASSPEFGFAILIPLMLLISPNAWIHYETILLLPFAILLSGFSKRSDAWQWLGLFAAFLPVAYGNEDTVMKTTSGLVQSYKFFGVFLFWLLAIVWAWKSPREAHPPSRPGALRVQARRLLIPQR
jgi:hypothetical protein